MTRRDLILTLSGAALAALAGQKSSSIPDSSVQVPRLADMMAVGDILTFGADPQQYRVTAMVRGEQAVHDSATLELVR